MWFVIRFVTWREAISSRTFWISGSENGASPRKVSSDQLTLAPPPPQSPP